MQNSFESYNERLSNPKGKESEEGSSEQTLSGKPVSEETSRLLTEVMEDIEVDKKIEAIRTAEVQQLIEAGRQYGRSFELDWKTTQMIIRRHSLALQDFAVVERASSSYAKKELGSRHYDMSYRLGTIDRKWIDGKELDEGEKTDVMNCIYIVGGIITSKAGEQLTPEEKKNIDNWHDALQALWQRTSGPEPYI